MEEYTPNATPNPVEPDTGLQKEKSMAEQLDTTLDTQGSIVFGELAQQDLRTNIARIDEQLKTAQENRDRLRKILEDNQPSDIYDPIVQGMETENTARLAELRMKVRDLFNEVAEKSQNNSQLLDQVLESRRRVTEGIVGLFGAVETEQAQLEKEINELEAEIEKLRSDQELADHKGRLQTELDKIKHDRCIFFGCIDVQPPELFDL
eukprot:Blabericola_migrator_1__8028@NODE_411_length_8732_cov_37_171725_g324_i0_p4_GENE_NODE_411_length_8732_cov_37_171725_g324_i0NODE_411_length_8732_cov_37_171725_g324_i0_p4_ORF_typecomplete_len207_score49_13MAD/PF05557_13/8_2e05PspA_IM30/PF04012_12/8_5PspA_IM30/PF04012_12/0_0042PHM7_cyt/PF14703_6/0_0032Rrp15p/PF07890_12/0_076GLTP/PF08718_11/0_013GLTP/PF08718_11/1_8e03AAA_13/PF13166_6/0_0088TarH/PF02203_15/0_011FlgN/PF05130_12/0_011FlgN/PF05130_12/3e02GBP_C/PF02841_14/43GBP_C/PF02841_14/0_014ZapB/PF06